MTEAHADPRVAFFDRHAATWDTDGPPIDETLRRLEDLRPLLPLRRGQDVLEVGCGTGQVTAWLAALAAPGRVTAVDFAPEMLERATARGVDAEFRCLDACRDDLGRAAFDLIFCMHAFPHFRDAAAALARFAQALRDGGRLVVLHLDDWRNINRFHDQVGPPVCGDHLPAVEDWDVLLARGGFETVALHDREDLFLLEARRAPDPIHVR